MGHCLFINTSTPLQIILISWAYFLCIKKYHRRRLMIIYIVAIGLDAFFI